MATCKLIIALIGEIDNQVRIGNYLSRSEFIRYAIKNLQKYPLLIDSTITFIDQFIDQILNSSQKQSMETKVVSFKLSQESANRLNWLSQEKQLSRSEIIRLGVVLLLLDEKRLLDQLHFRFCPLCGSIISAEMGSLSSEMEQISYSQVQKYKMASFSFFSLFHA